MAWLHGDRGFHIPGSIDGYEFDARFGDAVKTIYDSGELNPVVFSHSGAIMFWVLMNVKTRTFRCPPPIHYRTPATSWSSGARKEAGRSRTGTAHRTDRYGLRGRRHHRRSYEQSLRQRSFGLRRIRVATVGASPTSTPTTTALSRGGSTTTHWLRSPATTCASTSTTAAVLWNGGISFGGVVAFIFADLLILPILNIYRKYYGIKMMFVLLGTFYGAMVCAGYLVELLFGAASLVPTQRDATVLEAGIFWDYTTWLHIEFLVMAAVLVVRFVRAGGVPMLRMMGGAPGG
jgi:Predicted permease